MESKIIFIGNSVMLEKCTEIASKYFKKIFVITDDKTIKKGNDKKIKFINYNQLQKIKADYLISVLNEKVISPIKLKSIKKISINFHDGPLPKYAGLFSSSWAIYNKEKNHGVCWHVIEKEIDTGDIIASKKFVINKNDTGYTLDLKGVKIGLELFEEIIIKLVRNKINFKKQNLKKRSYFGKKKLKFLLNKYLKNHKKNSLIRAFNLSQQKYDIIQKLYKIDLRKKSNFSNEEIKKKHTSHEKKLLNIFKKYLKIDPTKIKDDRMIENLRLNNHLNWDSLTHVKILSEIEKSLSIKVNENNIDNFSSIEKAIQYINSKDQS